MPEARSEREGADVKLLAVLGLEVVRADLVAEKGVPVSCGVAGGRDAFSSERGVAESARPLLLVPSSWSLVPG